MSSLHDAGIATCDWTASILASHNANDLADVVHACLECCEQTLGRLTRLAADLAGGGGDSSAGVRLAFFADVVDAIAVEARKLVNRAETSQPSGVVSEDLRQVKICLECFAGILRRKDLGPYLALRQERPMGVRFAASNEALRNDIMNLMNRPLKRLKVQASPMPDLDRTLLERQY